MFQVAVLAIAAVSAAGARAPVPSRTLDIEQRIAAQRAIDGVYRSHQIDRPERGAQASDTSQDKRVRTYLRQALALEKIFGAKIGPEALHREVVRIAGHTRFPERVAEIYDALGRDPILVEECFARPLLVGRLIRNRFAKDPVIHAAARREADEIRRRLAGGDLDPKAPHARRREVEWRRDEAEGDAFEKLRRLVPRRVGGVSPVEETDERFLVRVLLEESARGVRMAEYEIPKVPWESWWRTVEERFDAAAASTISTGSIALPSPVKSAGSRRSEEAMFSVCNVSGGGWEALPGMPQARAGQTTVWTGTEMIVWGGGEELCDVYDGPYTNTGGRYDPLTDSWYPTSLNGAPSARRGHTAVWTGSEMIVWGGVASFGSPPFGNGARYDPQTDAWTPVSTANAPTSRFNHTAVWSGTKMIVWGGKPQVCASPLNSGGRYDPVTDTWQTTSTSGAPAAREQHTAIWTENEMIVWGGGTYDDCSCYFPAVLNSGARYDPVADQWTPLPTAGAPSARVHHTAVWAKSESKMIVWGGGTDVCQEINSGSAYDLAANLWVAVSSSGAPAARSSHTAVWTGDRMVVWGGFSCDGTLNTGGSYDPANNVWSATDTSGAPQSRALHSAVWTDASMIVWGGDHDAFYAPTPVAEGRSYNPTSNSWTPISDGSGPSARTGHTAVWSGNEMIVWGGRSDPSGSPFLNSGGRYDAIVDEWTSMSTLDAPSGRASHAAVWAGDRMLVWGGTPSAANTGGRYDPLSNSWSSMSSVSAPAVSVAPGVWTGTEMIVWGSSSGAAAGGRYDPATDLWTPISALGAPSPRIGHVAVWTGREMIVHGGNLQNGTQLQATGGRYEPLADTWQPTSTVNAALISSGAGGWQWTGTELVVVSSFGRGRYSPETDSWGSISNQGMPSFYRNVPAVWDGESIVASYGYYYPSTDRWRSIFTDAIGVTGTEVWTGTELLAWDKGVGGRYTPGQLLDLDGDGRLDCSADCDDGNAGLWSPPGEVSSLVFDADRVTLRWLPPADQGGTADPLYDVLRSTSPKDFFTGTSCVDPDGLDISAVDASTPPEGSAFYYLVRAQSACSSGNGPLAVGPNNGIRYGRQCP